MFPDILNISGMGVKNQLFKEQITKDGSSEDGILKMAF